MFIADPLVRFDTWALTSSALNMDLELSSIFKLYCANDHPELHYCKQMAHQHCHRNICIRPSVKNRATQVRYNDTRLNALSTKSDTQQNYRYNVFSNEKIQMYWTRVNFGDGNWRQAETWIVLLAGAVEVNALSPRSATAIHSVAMDRTPDLPIERPILYHWAIAAPIVTTCSACYPAYPVQNIVARFPVARCEDFPAEQTQFAQRFVCPGGSLEHSGP